MTRRAPIEVHENQGSLLPDEGPTDRPDLAIVPIAQPEVPTASGDEKPGPSVNLIDYYKGLAGVLRIYANMNQSENFIKRYEEGSPIVASQFKGRYQRYAGGHDGKLKDVQGNYNRLAVVAHDEFAKPFGRDEILGSSSRKTKKAVEVSMERAYLEFQTAYGGLANIGARRSFAGKIGRKIAFFEKQKGQKAA